VAPAVGILFVGHVYVANAAVSGQGADDQVAREVARIAKVGATSPEQQQPTSRSYVTGKGKLVETIVTFVVLIAAPDGLAARFRINSRPGAYSSEQKYAELGFRWGTTLPKSVRAGATLLPAQGPKVVSRGAQKVPVEVGVTARSKLVPRGT
jgi:hypothetical protein